MATKADIKKLLSKGLTGKEVARLILQDSWDVDHHKEGLLSERDISSLKAGLKTTQDIEDYNRFVDIYRLVDYTLKEARIRALEAENILLLNTREIDKYLQEDQIRSIQLLEPAIVTQKQYEELKAKQKGERFKEIFNLKQILDRRADRITPKDIQDKWMEGEEIYEYLFDFLQESYPDLWRQTVSGLLEDIKSGKLRLVRIIGKEQEKLEKAWQAIRDSQKKNIKEEAVSEYMEPDSEASKKTRELRQEEERLTRELYQAGRAKISQESQDSLASLLEQLQAGNLSEDEEYRILEFTFCSAEDLYKAGLPEWIQDLEEYIPDLDEETAARPTDMMQSTRVAIIQNPKPDDQDERGYWIERGLLNKVSGYDRIEAKDKAGTGHIEGDTLVVSTPDFLTLAHKQISERVGTFLAIQAVVEAISKVVGVNFSEDMENWYKELENHIELYNILLTPKYKYRSLPHYLGMPKLDSFKIGRIRPTAKSIKYYQDRMAIALGRDWWKEAIETLEFETEDQDSLAQKTIKDIEAVKASGKAEEATDGQEA